MPPNPLTLPGCALADGAVITGADASAGPTALTAAGLACSAVWETVAPEDADTASWYDALLGVGVAACDVPSGMADGSDDVGGVELPRCGR